MDDSQTEIMMKKERENYKEKKNYEEKSKEQDETIKEAHTESSQLVIFGMNVLMVLSVEITLKKNDDFTWQCNQQHTHSKYSDLIFRLLFLLLISTYL